MDIGCPRPECDMGELTVSRSRVSKLLASEEDMGTRLIIANFKYDQNPDE